MQVPDVGRFQALPSARARPRPRVYHGAWVQRNGPLHSVAVQPLCGCTVQRVAPLRYLVCSASHNGRPHTHKGHTMARSTARTARTTTAPVSLARTPQQAAARSARTARTQARHTATPATVAPATVAPASTVAPVVGPVGPQGQVPARYAPTTWANGMRAQRQALGYGRVAMAQALGVTTALYWQVETHYTAEQAAPYLARAAALPMAPRRTRG